MSPRTRVLCADAELAVASAQAAEAVGQGVDPMVVAHPLASAASALGRGETVAVVTVHAPAPEDLLALAQAGGAGGVQGLVGIVAAGAGDDDVLDLAADLGLVAVGDVAPLLSALAVVTAPGDVSTASVRSLAEVDRVRLRNVVTPTSPVTGRLVPMDAGRVGWQPPDDGAAHPLGPATALRDALAALKRSNPEPWARCPPIPDLNPEDVDDVLLGPPRQLSDPASKAALEPYGLPFPEEELCASPSRAAAEAGRLGFPVRMSLASPDLRVWDHPDLVLERVDTAARARDGFHQLTALAQGRAPEARVLGVTVTAATEIRARLWVDARSFGDGRVLARLGFADPHGLAARDATTTVLPATTGQVGRVLRRLAGASLLLDAGGDLVIREVTDVLVRLAAFLDDRRAEVERVEIRPLAVLVGDRIEVREVRVTVSDAYQRRLKGLSPGADRASSRASVNR